MPNRLLPTVSALALAAAVVSPAVAQPDPAKSGPTLLERYMKLRTPGAPTLAPDGTLYVRDWPDGVWQLYRVESPEGKVGAPMTRLTSFPDGVSGYSLSPDGSRILLLAAVGGNENNQIYLLDPKANTGKGKITPITDNPKVQHSLNHWLDDGSGFLFTANDASPNDFYVYRYDFSKGAEGAPGKATLLLGREGSWSASDITPDGSRALVTRFFSASNTQAYELSTKGGETTDITLRPMSGADGAEPTAANDVVGYMPGHKAVLMTSDHEEGIPRLFLKDLGTGKATKPLPQLDKFEVDGAGMNQEKTLLAVVTNEDGYAVPHLFRLPGFEPVKLPPMEKGVATINSVRGNTVIYSLSNARTPGLSFTFNVTPPNVNTTQEPMARQLTFCDAQGLDLASFPLPELVRFTSFDGVEIPAFVCVPAGFKKGTPIPFVVNYHGGPEGQHRPLFDRTVQYLVAEGFGVIQPNVRGSVGYGRAFHMMDDYKKRWDSVRDGVEAAEWLVKNNYAAPGRISTWGGSYGGFMSVACLVEDQERVDAGKRQSRLFGAGVNVVGITNVQTFLEKTSGYRRKLREAEYGPLSDPEFLQSVSPNRRVEKIQVPMFIAHGFNDPRVPVEEAMQLSIALKDRGLNPQLFIAPDEGHGFAKLDNRLLFTSRMSQFLKDTIAKPGK